MENEIQVFQPILACTDSIFLVPSTSKGKTIFPDCFYCYYDPCKDLYNQSHFIIEEGEEEDEKKKTNLSVF
jgi:hypothetical protein